jgi:hypothetical protein
VVQLNRAIPVGVTDPNLNSVRGFFILSLFSLSLFSLELCSLSGPPLLAHLPLPPGFFGPPFVSYSGPRPPRRLLSTSNQVDLSLT